MVINQNFMTGEQRFFMGHMKAVGSICVKDDLLVSAESDEDPVVRLWDIPSGRPLCALRVKMSRLTCVSLNCDSSLLACFGTHQNKSKVAV